MAPLHIDRGMTDILTDAADGPASWPSIRRQDVVRVDVVAQALVDGMAQRALARQVGVLDARDQARLDEMRLLGRLRPGERAPVTRERVEQALHAFELGLGEARAGATGIAKLAVHVEAH